MADPDANEVTTNIVGDDLNCHGNSPAAQIGNSTGSPTSFMAMPRGSVPA
jgi:hypothetical protein